MYRFIKQKQFISCNNSCSPTTFLILVFIFGFFYFSPAQISLDPFVSVRQKLPIQVKKIDSVLTKYYKESIKFYIDQVGELRISTRSVKYRKKFYDKRVHIQYEQPLSWVRQEFNARVDFKLKKNLYIRGETERKALHSHSGIFLFFKKEFE